MNFHLYSIILIYLFCILIIHILLKYSFDKKGEIDIPMENEDIYESKIENKNCEIKDSNNEDSNNDNMNNENDLIINNDELLLLSNKNNKKINSEIIDDLDENKAKNDLIDYLNFENDVSYHFLDNQENNTSKSDTNDQKIDKFFKSNNETDIYSFDPVPTNLCDKLDDNKNIIFNNVEAFDDLDVSYAKCF